MFKKIKKGIIYNLNKMIDMYFITHLHKMFDKSLRSQDNINSLVLNRPYKYEQTAQILSSLFIKNNIRNYFFIYGSLLSLKRDGCFQPKQGDMDIAVSVEHLDALIQLLYVEKRFLLKGYVSEILDHNSQFAGKNIYLDNVYIDNNPNERIALIKCFDSLNLIHIDFFILYPYSNNNYMIINDAPWGPDEGKTCYQNSSEFSDGLEQISFPSIIYPEYMRIHTEHYPHMNFVSYQVMKKSKEWLDRVYPDWDIKRMEEKSSEFFKDSLLIAQEKNKQEGYYFEFRVHPICIRYFTKNNDFSYKYNIE